MDMEEFGIGEKIETEAYGILLLISVVAINLNPGIMQLKNYH